MAKKNKDTCLSCNEARRRNDVRSCRILIVVAGEIWLSPCACLKAFAFDQRFERKDAHDLIYCIEHAPDGLDSAAAAFREAAAGKHGAVIRESLLILRRRFTSEHDLEGYRKDGPVAVAIFERGEGTEPELREARLLRQREVSGLVERLLALIG